MALSKEQATRGAETRATQQAWGEAQTRQAAAVEAVQIGDECVLVRACADVQAQAQGGQGEAVLVWHLRRR